MGSTWHNSEFRHRVREPLGTFSGSLMQGPPLASLTGARSASTKRSPDCDAPSRAPRRKLRALLSSAAMMRVPDSGDLFSIERPRTAAMPEAPV